MGSIISGYCGVTPLTDDELAVAYPLAAARLCVQALTWAVRGRPDPDRVRSDADAPHPAGAPPRAAGRYARRGSAPDGRKQSASLIAPDPATAPETRSGSGFEDAAHGQRLRRSEFDRLTPEAQALIRRREAVLAPSYRLFYRHPVVAVRGSGVWLYDADGNQYLDAYNNVPAVGHSHPHVQRLVSEQLGVLNTHTRYLTEPVITYSERLLALFPPELTKIVYTCTGSEAVDLALRIARYESGADGIICTSHAYHGTTAAAAAISPSLGPQQSDRFRRGTRRSPRRAARRPGHHGRGLRRPNPPGDRRADATAASDSRE